MEATLEKTSVRRKQNDSLLFNVPTPITNLEPIFTFNFALTEFPSFTITLNQKLKADNNKLIHNRFTFNEIGYCKFSLNESDDYFIKGELKLVAQGGTELSHCKMIIDYGKGTKEQFLLKGTFNFSSMSA